MVETEIYCHECDRYFRANFDASKDGNHVVNCPNCGHEHCRVIEEGKVTSVRWDRRNMTFNYAASTNAYTGSIYKYHGASTTSDTDSYLGSWTEWRSI